MPWYSEKIGPLPAGVWLGVIVAGVGGGLLWQRRSASKVPMVATGADTGTGETQAPLQATGYGTLVPATVTTVPTGPATNEEWVQQATDLLSSTAGGNHDSTAVFDALTAYISGASLTAAQAAYVTLARALLGNPPLALPSRATAPLPLPTKSATVWIGHQIKTPTTLIQLATQFAQSKTPTGIESTKRAIILHNPTIFAKIGTHNNAMLRVGWIVSVPVRRAA